MYSVELPQGKVYSAKLLDAYRNTDAKTLNLSLQINESSHLICSSDCFLQT